MVISVGGLLTETCAVSVKTKVWITGGGGLIGSFLRRLIPQSFQPIAPSHHELELTDEVAVRKFFARTDPELIIHCAGLTRSPSCQQDPKLARTLNVDLTRRLVEFAGKRPLYLFSTDLVFDGRKGDYAEDEAVNPMSVYGATKAEAEQIVLAHSQHVVVRTSINAGHSPTGDRAFNEELCRAWKSGKTTRLFVDEFRCPIPAEITARAAWELVQSNARGIFHLAGPERLSRFEIGRLVARYSSGIEAMIEASFLRDYDGPPRSPDTSLDCRKIQRRLSFQIPAFTAWLERNPNFQSRVLSTSPDRKTVDRELE